MNLQQFRAIAPKLDDDIAAVLKKYGLERRKRNATIDDRTGEISYRMTLIDPAHKGADGKATSPERETWKQLAALYGLKPEWLDKEFSAGGDRYKVTGLRGKASKNCVCITRMSDQSKRVSTVEMVIGGFAREKAAA